MPPGPAAPPAAAAGTNKAPARPAMVAAAVRWTAAAARPTARPCSFPLHRQRPPLRSLGGAAIQNAERALHHRAMEGDALGVVVARRPGLRMEVLKPVRAAHQRRAVFLADGLV